MPHRTIFKWNNSLLCCQKANALGITCICATTGSGWFDVLAPFALGFGGMTAPTLLLPLLTVFLIRKVSVYSSVYTVQTYILFCTTCVFLC